MRAQIYKYILILLGFFMISWYIWMRFIRERIPKNIPFTLSTLGFFILLYICCIYIYVVYSLLKKKNSDNIFITKIIDYIYKPLKTLDIFIKTLPFIYKYYKRFIIYITYKLEHILLGTPIYYYIFWILPRVILVSVLVIDTFYLHYLYYIYKILLIGILLFINRYIIYSLKYAKESFIENLTLLIHHGKLHTTYDYDFWTYYVKKYNINDSCEDEDDDDYVYENMYLPLKDFIEYQSESIFYNNHKHNYTAICNSTAKHKYCKKHHILYDENVDLPREIINEIFNDIDQKIENITKISLLLLCYESYSTYNLTIKKLKILIFLNYLLCWLYILIISYPTLPKETFNFIWKILDIEEPFSLLLL